MQKADIFAAKGQEIITLTLTTLRSLCDDSSFSHFWQKFHTSSVDNEIEQPT